MNIPDDPFFAMLIRSLQARAGETLQRRLYSTLREAIMQGQLQAQSWLPGSRVMAQRLSISRNTVNAALEQLAMEGYLHDINAIALSLDIDSRLSYDEAARLFAADLPDLAQEEKQPLFFNINFPKFLKDGRPQYVFGRQGKRDYINAFQKSEKDGRTFYTMSGEIYDSDKGSATDIYAIDSGYISVTPLITDLTDYMELEERLGK